MKSILTRDIRAAYFFEWAQDIIADRPITKKWKHRTSDNGQARGVAMALADHGIGTTIKQVGNTFTVSITTI